MKNYNNGPYGMSTYFFVVWHLKESCRIEGSDTCVHEGNLSNLHSFTVPQKDTDNNQSTLTQTRTRVVI